MPGPSQPQLMGAISTKQKAFFYITGSQSVLQKCDLYEATSCRSRPTCGMHPGCYVRCRGARQGDDVHNDVEPAAHAHRNIAAP
jgi:hypothetical protein